MPEPSFNDVIPDVKEIRTPVSSNWSLITFTFITTVSVALVCSSLMNGKFMDTLYFMGMIASAGIASLFHLGHKIRSRRSVSDAIRSPLNSEISLFIVFCSVSAASLALKSAELLLASSITGLVLLLAIDYVDIFSDNAVKIKVHAGQTFISGLLLASLLSNAIVSFIFIVSVKLAAGICDLSKKRDLPVFVLKFFRCAILLISSAGFATGLYSSKTAIYVLVFAGELFDRITFYKEFNPVNIESLINRTSNTVKDEKKNG